MALINITGDDFEKEVLSAKEPVLVFFWAAWIGPSKMVRPLLEESEAEFQARGVKAVSVDVERNVDLAMNQFITSLPTLFMFKDGQKIAEQTGMVSPARLREITSVALP